MATLTIVIIYHQLQARALSTSLPVTDLSWQSRGAICMHVTHASYTEGSFLARPTVICLCASIDIEQICKPRKCLTVTGNGFHADIRHFGQYLNHRKRSNWYRELKIIRVQDPQKRRPIKSRNRKLQTNELRIIQRQTLPKGTVSGKVSKFRPGISWSKSPTTKISVSASSPGSTSS